MWDLIINPFVTLLTWMYAVFGNNVVLAIVVFTVLVRVLTFPLMAKQTQSAKRMQELQPRLKKLQEKYKDDREKLAQAQMELYKEAGVNPFGGCLPLLIQFPILIALYQAIYFALANTPYQLVDLSERLIVPGLDNLIPLENMWLGMDLTQPPTPPINPAYALVLPLLVMATTYIQSKMTLAATGQSMTSTTKDGEIDQAAAMSRSMTTVMPIMLGAFALSFSVGLSVYFITSNILGIIQYSPAGKAFLERMSGGDKAKNDVITDEGIKPAVKPAMTAASFSTNGSAGENSPRKTKKKKAR